VATFADLLRYHRVEAGLTQEVLAERAGLSVYGIQKLERGATRPYRDTAQRLASALELAPDARARFLALVVPVRRRGSGARQEAPNAALPSGTLTFLLTDVEGSTQLWERDREAMRAALARHDVLINGAVAEHGGIVVRPRGEGDGRLAAFTHASAAVSAAAAIQLALYQEAWTLPRPLRVRLALHTGEADLRDGDYFGDAVNRCAQLRALARGGQILLSGVTADLVRDVLPSDASLRDVGRHRLNDLGAPERIWQLAHPGLRSAEPLPLQSLDTVHHNLPAELSSFVGRRQQVIEVARLLEEARVLTLVGTGGVGKTRLGLQVAAEVLERYMDGVWLVELAPLADPRLAPQAVAAALYIPEQPRQPIVQTLVDNLRSRRALLVLDNCEHLVQACAELVDALLRACPDLTILATSREPLHVAGEIVWRVQPLGLPASDAYIALANSEAGQLFLERASASSPDFAATTQNTQAIVHICRGLDGLPLAIELAAARVGSLSVEQIADRLEDRLRLLTSGSRTGSRRIQTLRGAIDWSVDLLSEDERLLFERLGIFVDGWTLEASEAVCSGDGLHLEDVLGMLCSLVDKSLVVAQGGDKYVRYRLLETLRQYALERLDASGGTEPLRRRHTQQYLALAEEVEPRLRGDDQAFWLDQLEAEHDNLRAALSWCFERCETDTGLRLGAALWRFWEVHGHLREGRERLQALLALPAPDGQSPKDATRAAALNALGNMARHQGEYTLAQSAYEESVAIRRELDDRPGVAGSLSNLGVVAALEGDFAVARAFFEESLRIRLALGDQLDIANSHQNLGRCAAHQRDYTAARSHFAECLAISQLIGNRRGVASALIELGKLAEQQSGYAAARTSYESGLAISRELGDKEYIAETLEGFATLAAAQAQPERALRLAAAAAALRESINARLSAAELDELEQALDSARSMLTPEASSTAWSRGKRMSLDDVMEYACQ
jgi:predicted ATPase/class 3 adenylate cyclase